LFCLSLFCVVCSKLPVSRSGSSILDFLFIWFSLTFIYILVRLTSMLSWLIRLCHPHGILCNQALSPPWYLV
jgi:hypothetical protein